MKSNQHQLRTRLKIVFRLLAELNLFSKISSRSGKINNNLTTKSMVKRIRRRKQMLVTFRGNLTMTGNQTIQDRLKWTEVNMNQTKLHRSLAFV